MKTFSNCPEPAKSQQQPQVPCRAAAYQGLPYLLAPPPCQTTAPPLSLRCRSPPLRCPAPAAVNAAAWTTRCRCPLWKRLRGARQGPDRGLTTESGRLKTIEPQPGISVVASRASTHLRPPARRPLAWTAGLVCCRRRTLLQAGPSSSPEHSDIKRRPAEGRPFLRDHPGAYLEGWQADGSSEADSQAHPLVSQPLALVPVFQQTRAHRLFGFGSFFLFALDTFDRSQRRLWESSVLMSMAVVNHTITNISTFNGQNL